MNSAQRRKFRRKWKYTVQIGKPSSRGKFHWDAMRWAEKTVGKNKFRVVSWNCFVFDDELNALQFALRWNTDDEQ